MNKHCIIIKTKTRNKNRVLVKFYKNNIPVYDCYFRGEELYLKIDANDLENVQDKITLSTFTYVSDSGIYHLKNVITPLKIFAIVFFIIFVNFFSHVIVSVDVIHSNKEIRDLVRSTLEDYGIKKFTFQKDYEKLQEIKKNITTSYKDKIEWLEIEQVGMKYVVRIEERILNSLENEEKFCHIVASKSGIISSIRSTKGEILVENGKYVQEGERLISGSIFFNEEVKNNVCASGTVLAEVWYTTTIHLPIHYTKETQTGKMRYNLEVETSKGNHKIFKSRLENYETKKIKLFTLFDITFYILKEYEVQKEESAYTLDSGLEKSISLADEKMNLKLKNEEWIKSRNVLKKSINDSTIDVELFYVVIEDIAKIEEYVVELEEEGS